MTKENVN